MRIVQRLLKYFNLRKEVEKPPCREGVQLAGYAVLIKDPITGLRLFSTCAWDGSQHTNLSPEQPLIVPATKVQVGTRIEIWVPTS